MQKRILFFIMMILAFNQMPLSAQNSDANQPDESNVPSGMEARKVDNNVTILMPKGGRMHRTNETTYVQESTDEYAARNFASVENRLGRLEKENGEFKEEIKNIKSRLNADKSLPDVSKE